MSDPTLPSMKDVNFMCRRHAVISKALQEFQEKLDTVDSEC